MRVAGTVVVLTLVLAACGGGSGGDDHAPFISAVSPRWIAAEGGTRIEIQGNDFTPGAVEVTVGGVPVTALVVENPRRIRCTAPAHVPGADFVADLRVVSEGVVAEAQEALGFVVRLPNPEPAESAAFGGNLRRIRTPTGTLTVPGRSLLVADLDATAPLDIAVGVPGRSFGGNDEVGEVLVYYGEPDGTFSAPTSIRPQTIAGLAFGFSLAAGDMDGDFLNDLLIGAPGGSRAYMAVTNGPARTFEAPVVVDTDPDPTSQYGFAVALGQFDATGHAAREAIIGAPGATAAPPPPAQGGEAGGIVRVLQDGLQTDLFNGQEPFQNLGTAVIVPDQDGDGVDDLILGAPGRTARLGGVQTRTGSVESYMSDGTSGVPGFGFFPAAGFPFSDVNPLENAETGTALAVGVFDNVGGEDYLVGMPGDLSGTSAVRGGSARVYFSDGLGGVSSALELLEPQPEGGARFGLAVTTGDFDGDLQLDAAVAAPLATVGFELAAGRVSIFFGNRAELRMPFEAAVTEPTPERSARFGAALASGDFNRDGRDDLVVATHGSDSNQSASGEVFVVFQPRPIRGP